MTADPEEFSAACDWCHIEVVSAVGEPHLVSLKAEPLPGDLTSWHICLECYMNLLRLVSDVSKASRALA